MRFALVFLMLASGVAHAHIAMTFPAPRSEDQKVGPCGGSGSTRGSNVSTFAPGETITVEWDETIDHPGHYRIAFDDDGNDDFPLPQTPDDNFATTLVDQIADGPAGPYSQQVTLPTTPCTNCTLQLVQVMTTSVPYNSFYFQCADITISGDAPPPQPETCGGSPAAMCCSSGGGTLGGLAALGLLGLVLRRRRR